MAFDFSLSADFSSIISEVNRLQGEFDKLERKSVSTIAKFKTLDNGMVQATVTIKGLTQAGQEFSRTATFIERGMIALEKEIDKFAQGNAHAGQETQRLTAATESLADTQKRLQQELKKTVAEEARQIRATESLRAAIARGEKEIRDMAQAERLASRESVGLRNAMRGISAAAREYESEALAAARASRRLANTNKTLNVHLDRTLNTFARLLSLRIAAGFFFAVERQMRETIQTATELSQRIGEVQTIIRPDEQTLIGYERLNESIKDFSRAYNFELLDTVEAFYDNLSNQIADNTKDLVQFTNVAATLAKATVSSLEDSSNALTAVINAFGLNINQASNIAGAFFNTVDLGRVRLEELANTMGTVAVPAEQLGITYQELFGAIATISRRGIDAARTQTLMRNIILKLLKPTGKMVEILDDWGVNSGRAAIETFGLLGVFQKLEEITRGGGGPEEIAKAFSRIRAIVGSQALISAIDEFADDIKSMVEDVDRLNTAFEIVQKNVGETFAREINQVRVDLTEAFGQKAINNLVQYHNEVADLSETFKVLGVLAASFGAAVGVAVIAPLALAGVGLGIAVVPYLAAIAAITVASTALFLLWEDGSEQLAKDAVKAAQETEAAFLKANQKIADTFSLEIDEALKPQLQLIAAQTAGLTKENLLAEFKLKTLILQKEEHIKLLELQISSQKSQVLVNGVAVRTLSLTKEKLRLQKEIVKNLEDEKELIKETFLAAEQSIERARFERSLRNVPETAQQFRRASFAGQLTREGQKLITAGEIEAGTSLLEEARTILSALDQAIFAENGLQSNRFTTQLMAIEDILFNSLARRGKVVDLNLEKQRMELELTEQIINKKKEKLEQEKNFLEFLNARIKTIEETRENELFTIEEQNTAIENQIALVGRIFGAESDVVKELETELRIRRELNALTIAGKDVSEREAEFKLRSDEAAAILAADKTLRTKIETDLIEFKKVLSGITESIVTQGLSGDKKLIASPLFTKEIAQLGALTSDSDREIRELLRDVLGKIVTRSDDIDVDVAVFAPFNQLFKALNLLATNPEEVIGARIEQELLLPAEKVLIEEIKDAFVKIEKSVIENNKNIAAAAVIAEAERTIAAEEQAKILIESVKSSNDTIVAATKEAATVWISVANGIFQLGRPIEKASGGMIYGQSGIDRVPAMLTAGEFVINRAATQSHLALLHSINAGHGPSTSLPQRYAHGGEVNHNSTTHNANSITVQSTGNEAVDARTLLNKLSVEQHRGRGPRTRKY